MKLEHVDLKAELWEKFKGKVKECKKCSTRGEALFPVPGEGSLYAEVMFVGRAPGKTENKEGRPFCGASGRSLDWFLNLIRLKREDIFISNMCLCYPAQDRPNTDEEIQNCREHFISIINIIKPKLVIVCGTQAGQELTGLKSLGAARGKVWKHVLGFDVVCILHPGVLPISHYAKQNVEAFWQDAFFIRKLIKT